MTCSRREVLYTIGIGAGAAMIGCSGGGGDDAGVPTGSGSMCGSNLCFKLSENSELQLVGGMLFFTAGSKKLFVQRVSDTELLALSAVCTHAGCTVSFNGVDRFSCPCHGSAFDPADGSVLNGPAARPLANFAAAITGDDVEITLG